MIVKYRRLYPYAPYLNEEIGFEKGIPDDATEEEMISTVLELKKISDKSHDQLNPPLNGSPQYTSMGPQVQYPSHPIPEVQVEKQSTSTLASLIADINNCDDIKVLESYRLLAKKDSAMQYAYDRKLKQLTELGSKNK